MSTEKADAPDFASAFPSFVHVVRWRALQQPNRLAFTLLADGRTEDARLTYADVDRQARAVAAVLQSYGASGQRALLLCPPGADYLAAFFGCLYAGVVAVPAYLPDPSRLERTLARLLAVVADAQTSFVITTAGFKMMAQPMLGIAPDLGRLRWLTTDELPEQAEDGWREPELAQDALALLQYTSGSTRTPKGVMLSHANLLHNATHIAEAFRHTPDDIFVSWLPPYHDMGLIGGILQPLLGGVNSVLMSPMSFLQHPAVWLQAISHYKATISGGPNFAYDLCARKVSPEVRATLDLSHWTLAFDGAEPIRPETLDRFTAAFEPCGFRREAFLPCYGLAETTLIVTGSTRGTRPVVQKVDKAALQHNRVVDAPEGSRGAQALVSSGRRLGPEVVIVDPETSQPSLPDQVGEIWVSGPSVARGYWKRPDDPVFQAHLAGEGGGPFLRTGDLGFFANGELFVTGRVKDLIILRGRNHYPQDIEFTVEQSHPACRPGCGAAFSVDIDSEERLVVAQELDTRQPANRAEVINAIRRAIANTHEIHAYAVLLLEPRSIPKTSSGKIQRQACRNQFLAGTLDVITANIVNDADHLSNTTSLTRASLLAAAPDARPALLEAYLQTEAAHVLRISAGEVDPTQPLGALGFDSIMVTGLVDKLETDLGVDVDTLQQISGASISQLVSYVLAGLTASAPSTAGVEVGEPNAQEYPLSFGQRALWFLQQMAPQSGAYNIVYAVRISTAVDSFALQCSVEKWVEHHPALRTTFNARHGDPVQCIHDQMPGCFRYEDASGWNEDELGTRLAQEVYYPFDLEHGPLMRVTHLMRSPAEHIVILAMHHIISDLWSIAILLSEMGALSPAAKAGLTAAWRPSSVQYTDYVRWQSESMAGPEGEALWAYWRTQLAGELPALNLPTDRPRPAVQTYRGASQTMRLSEELTRRLESISQAHGTPLHVTLLAAFQALLYRYSGQENFQVGSPKMARRAHWTRLVGYFVNVVPLRADLSGNPTFLGLLDRVHTTVTAAAAHDTYPFALLVERLQPERDLSRSPLFQVMFAWQKSTGLIDSQALTALALGDPEHTIDLGGLQARPMPLEDRVVPFDLSLLMAPSDAQLVALLEYNKALFDAATITRLLRNFETLLQAVVEDPEQPVATLPLLSTVESQQLLVDWNAVGEDGAGAPSIQRLFEAQVEQTPDAIAIVFRDDKLTFRELNKQANQLAHHLRELGVGPQAFVGVYVERSAAMVVALLGILKAGAAYLPLDPTHPRERLGYMLADSRARVVLTQGKLVSQLPAHSARVVRLDTDSELIARCSDSNLPDDTSAEDVAYLLYTSGSTGEPKGVLVANGALANHCREVRRLFELGPNDRVLQFAAVSFDPSLEQMLTTLIAGATLILRGPELLDGKTFNQMVAVYGLTVVNVPPAYWHEWALAWSDAAGLAPNEQLRLVIVGGDVMSPASLLLWQATPMRSARLLNAYGPTETTITAATYEIPAECCAAAVPERIPIGRPLPGRTMYILDPAGKPTPIGVPGELHIGGCAIALGYLNNAELTAEKFIPDPFVELPAARLYRTGDLARYLQDGNIEFLGRVDEQVKIRGMRVELGEIEHALSQHPAVRQAVVLFSNGAPGDESARGRAATATDAGSVAHEKHLVAYVVQNLGAVVSVGELRSCLKQRLPDVMVPAAFVMLESLPLSASGKVDRRALPAPDLAVLKSDAPYSAPRTRPEAEVAQIWAELLGVEQIGIYDNFFAVGGHSLMATRLISRLRDAFQVELPLHCLFEAPTVAELTVAITQMRAEREGEDEVNRLLDELEQLPEEAARTFLASGSSPSAKENVK